MSPGESIPQSGGASAVLEILSDSEVGRRSEIGVLTAAMTKGDETAFREFFQSYFPRLLAYLLVVTGGREEAAREAVQATLVRVARHIRPFQSADAFWSWLTVLARTATIDHQRKTARYRGLLTRVFEWSRTHAEPEPDDPDAHLLSILEKELAALPDPDREMIQRKYFDGESVRGIASTLGITEKAVDSRLVRARRQLKQMVLAELSSRNEE